MALDWEFDKDFFDGIERACASRQVSTYQIELHNIEHTLSALRAGELFFSSFYDRASDSNEAFQPVAQFFHQSAIHQINPYHLIPHAADKATMHLELLSRGLQVPYTIIVPPYNEAKEFDLGSDILQQLRTPFIIKPANTTGGGTGVILDAQTFEDVIAARQHHKNDKYLLQEKIIPMQLNSQRAWFRIFYAFGTIILCWWDDRTHHYIEVLADEERQYTLSGLRRVMSEIQQVCRLDFFSSEIVMTGDDTFVVVDYVNEICDMRLQSKFADGVPDSIVHNIEQLIALDVEQHLQNHEQKEQSNLK